MIAVVLPEIFNKVSDLGLLEMLPVHKLHLPAWFRRVNRAGGLSWLANVVLHDSSWWWWDGIRFVSKNQLNQRISVDGKPSKVDSYSFNTLLVGIL